MAKRRRDRAAESAADQGDALGDTLGGATDDRTDADWERTDREGPDGADEEDAANQVDEFAAQLPFALDPYQREAALRLARGRSVLVAAPTGTGKTVVAEFAIWRARRAGQRAIYTAPLKALSNQKYRDLRRLHGAEAVGLLTGDIVEHPTAPIVVMTTEIYRNMLLEGSRVGRAAAAVEAASTRSTTSATSGPAVVGRGGTTDMARQAALDDELSNVGCVIFDELHYLSDLERGPVWEEAIIHSPAHVTLVGLSATVSNADQLRAWIARVHGSTDLSLHVERAVPLEDFYFLDGNLHLVRDADGNRIAVFPGIGGEAKLARERMNPRRYVFDGARSPATDRSTANDPTRSGSPRAETGRPASGAGRAPDKSPRGPAGAAGASAATDASSDASADAAPIRREAPQPGEILTALRAAGLLPCLYFLPGRRAVETAAESAASHLLVSPDQRARVHAEVQGWVRALPAEDQRLDQVRRLATLLPRGLAFHHAGLLPGLKVMVETLFARGDLRAVFATDTLALGINMPARSVVLGSLSKFDGTSMRLLTPNEYQQLTGRAGRRGMDAKGAAVIPYSPWDQFEPAFALLTGPLLPVISAFIVRYNTILNLWRPGDMTRLRSAVAASLREFQRHGVDRDLRQGAERDPARPARRKERDRRRPDRFGLSRAALAELNATIMVLRLLGYIGEDDHLTLRGRLLRALFHPAGMVLTELALSDALDDLGPAELAEVVSWFTFDDDRSLRNLNTLPHRLMETRREIYRALRLVQGMEYDYGVTMSPGVSDDFYGIALNWWRGMSLGGLLRRVDLAEGDLLVSLNQTIDLLQQLQGAVGQALDDRELWGAADDEEFGEPGSGEPPAVNRRAGEPRGGASRPGGRRRRRDLARLHDRLTDLRPALDAAWRGLLRGSVAQSRAIPSMVTTTPTGDVTAGPASPDAVPLPMAEDEDAADAAQDRATTPTGPDVDADRPIE